MSPAHKHHSNAHLSTGGSRKKGKKRRIKVSDTITADAPNPNADIVVPKSKDQKDVERKERLLKELIAQSESKVSSKKKRRLEKYIDKKLKKEERLVIFEHLTQTQATVQSLDLHSSSTLGTGRVVLNRDRIDRKEDMEARHLMNGRPGKRRRHNFDFSGVGSDCSESEDAELDNLPEFGNDGPAQTTIPENKASVVDFSSGMTVADKTHLPQSAVGQSLKRNKDGTVMAPLVVKKKAKGQKTAFRSWRTKPARPAVPAQDPNESDSSAYDTSEEEDKDTDGVAEDVEPHVTSSQSGSESGREDARSAEEASESRQDFKTWAMKGLSAAKAYVVPIGGEQPAVPSEGEAQGLPPPKKRKVSHVHDGVLRGPLGEDLKLPATSLAEQLSKVPSSSTQANKCKAVLVTRPSDVEEGRLMLPILAEEQPIMEATLLNPVVIICGETGSGKTTQVPQFLYEAGFGNPSGDNPGMIGVTQPRRVAAMSMAARVAHELSLSSSQVSYQIRYDATVSPATVIKFMTDGVLLRELATDFSLSKYSVVVIDEAHERSMNTDILIGVLSRVLKLREQMWKEGKENVKPLRLVIMSATLRVSDFVENRMLFSTPPPVVNVAARQHPVTIHFNRRTPTDYVYEAIKKTAKIHARLPPGGILIFLTGQNEITGVCKKLEAKFSRNAIEVKKQRRQVVSASAFFTDDPPDAPINSVAAADVLLEAEDVDLGPDNQDLASDVDAGIADEDPEALDSDHDEVMETDIEESDFPMHVVPLYSLLPSDKQMRVFQPPPLGCRLVVVSTNVAETSLTIPGIRYVVDCGRAKERKYDARSGIQSFQVSWISKASAAQRAGRAGRTGPGHCYRLYSSALYEHYFQPFSEPEILRTPIEGVVLQMKAMNIDAVANFPFPTPPEMHALKKAETALTRLGALINPPVLSSSATPLGVATVTIGGSITPLGRSMSLFPLAPRHARMLVVGQQHGCLPYVIAIVSILSVGDPFLREEGLADAEKSDEDEDELEHIKSERIKAKEAQRTRRRAFFEKQQIHAAMGNSTSDIFRMLSVVGAYEYAGGGFQFCNEHFVRPKAMEEIHKLRAQISSLVSTTFPGVDVGHKSNLQPPTETQLKALRQLLAAAFIDQVAVRKDLVEKKFATGVQFSTAKGVPYRALGVPEDVFIHPSSILWQRSPPDYLVFTEIVRTTKPWLKGLTLINPAWLSTLGKQTLCIFTKATKDSKGNLMTTPRFGPDQWELPPIKVSR